MKRVLLLATTTGYQIRSFGEAARAVRAALMFASDRCDQLDDPWADHAIPVRFSDDVRAAEGLLAALAGRRPDGLIAVGDRPTVLLARVASALGLPGNSPASAVRSRNKLQARAAFQSAGLPVPAFMAASLNDDAEALAAETRYPVVLKPLALSGSRGVIRVNDPQEFVTAFTRVRTLMLASVDIRMERDAAHDGLLIESFVPGAEFATEGLLTEGVFAPLAIFDKPDPLDGPFFEETIYVTPSRQPAAAQQRIVAAVADAARALGLRHGPIHAECRVNGDGVYVLEVAPRPIGGLCSKSLRFVPPDGGTGTVTLEEVLLRHAIGEDVSGYRREARASAVMMIPIPGRGVFRGVHGVEEASRVAGVDGIQITAKRDALLIPLPEGRSYLGFIFARAGDSASAERAVRDAHARLRFDVDREVPLAG